MLSRRIFFGLPITLPFLTFSAKAAPKVEDDPLLNWLDRVILNAQAVRSHLDGTSDVKFCRYRTRAYANFMRIEAQIVQQEIYERFPVPKDAPHAEK